MKIKVSQPMFEVGELERFDNNIHSIVEEYSKLMFKEKDQILTQRIIMKQEQEIERLNKIIKTKDEGFKASIEELTDYANRIDKAIEYIKEAKEQNFIWTPIFMKELLNILEGE